MTTYVVTTLAHPPLTPQQKWATTMNAVNDIVSQLPLDQLAQQLGVDRGTAEQATRQALPALLGGIHANAQHPDGAASLTKALGQHDARSARCLRREATRDCQGPPRRSHSSLTMVTGE